MSDKLTDYRRADAPLPARNRLWPLYAAGFDHMGRAGQPIDVPMPQYGPDELLVRHDACGLCFSDVKVVRAGEKHPRIYRDIRQEPVVLGHEATMTVVGVGERLRGQYRIGERFLIQADVYVNGVNLAYGYEIQGGLSQYNVIDQRVLNGDAGNYLLPVQPHTGYAETALTEPWACVVAAYRLSYRTTLKPGGTTWIIGPSFPPPPRGETGGAAFPPPPRGGAGGEILSSPPRGGAGGEILSSPPRGGAGGEILSPPPRGGGGGGAVSPMIEGDRGEEIPYTISTGFDETSHPARLLLTNVPPAFSHWLKQRAQALSIKVIEVPDIPSLPSLPSPGKGESEGGIDDIILLTPDPDLIEAASPHLAKFGIMAIIAGTPLPRKVNVDVGRIHYNRWLYVGGPGPDVARAYSDVPVRSELKPGGRAWFIGAGGPMGSMHVQRAIEAPAGPQTILCTAQSERRLRAVEATYRADAEARGIAFTCVSQADEAAYRQTLETAGAQGFDDVVVLAPVTSAVAEAAEYVAPGGVLNVFAGLGRGTMVSLDLSAVYLKGVRIIGHSGSTLDDMQLTLEQVEAGRLSPDRLVAAIGSLSAARDGLRAVEEAVFPGKIVIYPHIQELPLTPLADLKHKLPTVYAKLKDGREWTIEAEEELLHVMLP
jgi:threonine dehydrogenase-like Zn-dependent dehydrogenase